MLAKAGECNSCSDCPASRHPSTPGLSALHPRPQARARAQARAPRRVEVEGRVRLTRGEAEEEAMRHRLRSQMQSWGFPFLIFLVLIFCVLVGIVVAAESDPAGQFFYADNPDANVVIHDYVASAYPLHKNDDTKDRHPDFLFSKSYPNPRVVEFYAHWCPHCKHFRKRYTEVAATMKAKYGDMNIEFWAISCVPNAFICRDFDIHSYPNIRVLPAHSANSSKIEHFNLHPFQIFRMANIEVAAESQDDTDVLSIHADSAADSDQAYYLSKTKQQIYQDALLSFRFLCQTSVFTTSDNKLSPDAKLAFNKFVRHLQKVLPPTMTDDFHSILAKIIEHAKALSEDTLMDIVGTEVVTDDAWSPACRHHDSPFTCGLWHLFHMYSIGYAEYNAVALSDDTKLEAGECAQVMRDFIVHFFNCEDCRQHFANDYDACKYGRCERHGDDREFALWLFEFHNGVNRRLHHGVVFPSTWMCAMCWKDEAEYDPDIVYKYLRLMYWPSDEKARQYRQDVLSGQHVQRAEEEQEEVQPLAPIEPNMQQREEEEEQHVQEQPSPDVVAATPPVIQRHLRRPEVPAGVSTSAQYPHGRQDILHGHVLDYMPLSMSGSMLMLVAGVGVYYGYSSKQRWRWKMSAKVKD